VALYRAKAEGRGTFQFFTEAMDREVKARVSLARELRKAITDDELELYYQPQVDLVTGEIRGVEALVRWNHPRRGLVGPDEFVEAAERAGLIIDLGRWVMREACRQASAWAEMGVAPGLVAINISALQFRTSGELEKDISRVLEKYAVPPQMLELELTETVLMDASRRHAETLQRLRDRGVRIAIDDFGMGYSSLDYLRCFPVDRIKIAQNFIADLEQGQGDRAIVRAALGLARELGLGVIAEGIEAVGQVALLRSWGCREGQGFYFARPEPAAQMTEMLRTRRFLAGSDTRLDDDGQERDAAEGRPGRLG
jgi:EAL domain-containing protein (putative c-di-GMP-specific phosphodiesterase class I)